MKKEFIGEWYYSDNEDKKFNGRLTIDDNNKILLSIVGRMCKHNEIEIEKTINGITNEGKYITLLNCLVRKYSLLGAAEMVYSAKMIIIGVCYKCSEDIKISKINCNYTDLNKWLFINSFDVDNNDNELNIKYVEPEINEYDIGDFKFRINNKRTCKGNFYEKISVIINSSIEFEFEKQIGLLDAIDKINHFRNLLTIFTSNKIESYDINFIDKDNKSVSLIFNKMATRESTNIDPYEIFVKYNNIKDNFENILTKWYQYKEKIQPIIDYLVYVIEEDKFVVPLTFITIIQAVEAFSRRTRNNCKYNVDEHTARVNRILNDINDEEDIKWLGDILKYTNEPSLPQRLKSMLNEMDFLIKINTKKKKSLCCKISTTRNYYTHFSEDKKNDIMNIDEMFRLTEYFRLVLRILIFKDLGISEEVITCNLEYARREDFTIKYFKKQFMIE
ncbi:MULTISPECIES: HEPN domain-containing protein [Clostridium]|uniref:ApeA N-terminal domain 1-containing protein n=1 Tax=Clostridium TaxID=1485 RepID=UPI000CF68EFA|nr:MULTISPECIES: HEPN domain-containing protein [Clostridium]NFR88264.1 hypothetical protein [Clostridium botulinum]NFR88571.1 hypothetical protein [Clostridium botulinum]NFU00545.1 hypothetical protein [Clostridium botulinum]